MEIGRHLTFAPSELVCTITSATEPSHTPITLQGFRRRCFRARWTLSQGELCLTQHGYDVPCLFIYPTEHSHGYDERFPHLHAYYVFLRLVAPALMEAIAVAKVRTRAYPRPNRRSGPNPGSRFLTQPCPCNFSPSLCYWSSSLSNWFPSLCDSNPERILDLAKRSLLHTLV